MRLTLLVLTASLLSACATTRLPESSSDMASIYAGTPEAGTPDTTVITRDVHGGVADLSGWTRDAATELSTRFPRVPNPTLVMYVFPHVASDLPVPGYITTFPLWESAPFALPGETPTAMEPITP